LRNSFPATALQGGSDLSWKNMLDEHGVRQIPGADLAHSSMTDAHTTADLDAQYWQNINEVRVAGSGNTNYVVAKDDVGNWYVKNYSADPGEIYKSAFGLASYALGGSLKNPGLLTKPASSTGGSGAAPATQPSILQGQVDRAKKQYDDDTAQDAKDVRQAMDDVVTETENAWSADKILAGDLKQLNNQLDAIKTKVLDPATKTADDSSNKALPADKIIDELRAMKQFSAAADAMIPSQLLPDDPKKTSTIDERKANAVTEAESVASNTINKFLARRQQVVGKYQTQINMIGGSVSAPTN
jgi:hypothetical protein